MNENLEKNYKKLYYESENSSEKVFPYYVRFENEKQAKTAIYLLEKAGFEKVDVPNAKSFNLYVNFKFKRYSRPNIAFWYVGCKDYLTFEQFNTLLAEFCNKTTIQINRKPPNLNFFCFLG